MLTGNLIVISGPSGAGKGTLVAGLRKRVPDLFLSVSMTTRAPRAGEVPDVSYRYVSRQEFEEVRRRGGFLEWATVHDNLYGTPADEVGEQLAAGNDVILEIDVKGALQVKKKMPEAHLVFIQAPSVDDLAERLSKRQTEDPRGVAQRVRVAKHEILLAPKYDCVIVNDDVIRATNELVGIVREIRRTRRRERL